MKLILTYLILLVITLCSQKSKANDTAIVRPLPKAVQLKDGETRQEKILENSVTIWCIVQPHIKTSHGDLYKTMQLEVQLYRIVTTHISTEYTVWTEEFQQSITVDKSSCFGKRNKEWDKFFKIVNKGEL